MLGLALRDEMTAGLACAGTEIDHEIGAANGVFVVLDDEDGVAEIPKLLERTEQRSLSRACNPIEGSSRTYKTPRRREPICVARRMRCASPPESVAAERSRLR